MKKTLLFLFLLLSAISVLSASDTSYVKVEKQDWLTIQEYVTNSQTQLKEAQIQLENLQTDLEKSLSLVETLKTYSINIESQLNRQQKWNKILIGGIAISLTINVVFIILLVR